MDNIEELLPIGSVVLLENGIKKIMIIGIKPTDLSTNTIYDYLAVPYPEGFIKEDCTFFVNHDKIQKVVARGYENEERKEFITKLAGYYAEQK